MRHAEPRIQELVEMVQGCLQMFTDREIVWSALRRHGSYEIGFTILMSANDAYAMQLTLAERVLREPFWENVKWNLVRSVVLKLVSDAKPVGAEKVRFYADPRFAVSNGDDNGWDCVAIPKEDA